MPGHTTKRLTDADVDTLFELVRVSLDDKSMLDWHRRLREIRDKMIETLGDLVQERDAKIHVPYPGDLNTIETAVWAAEYVRYLAARSTSTERWPPDIDDVDDAVDDANETVAELRRKRERS